MVHGLETMKKMNESVSSGLALGGKIYWQDLAKQLAEVWWEVTKVGATLQHGDLDKAETMFSVVLEKHGGQCFHGETPMDAWKKAEDWLKSPERPSFALATEEKIANVSVKLFRSIGLDGVGKAMQKFVTSEGVELNIIVEVDR